MASWTELAGGEEVAVGGATLGVCGISIDGLALLVQRFPELVEQLIVTQKLDAGAIIFSFPKAAVIALAAGIGEPGNEDCERKLARLSLVDQIALMEAVIRQTIGGDEPGPFVERLKRVGRMVGFSPERWEKLTESSPQQDSASGAEVTALDATLAPSSAPPSNT